MADKPKSFGPLILSIIGLGALAVFCGYGAFVAFKMGGIGNITAHGWAAMILCLIATAALTGGFIWLAFYSSRHGYDDDQSL